jgi:hypothetical protein
MHTNRTATGDTLHGKLEVGDVVVLRIRLTTDVKFAYC